MQSPNYKEVLDAAFNALEQYEPMSEGIEIVLDVFENTPVSEQSNILPLLAEAGGTDAFNAVRDKFNSGDASMKKSAVQALLAWKGTEALDGLFEIYKLNGDFKEEVFKGYLALIDRLEIPDDQKRLYIQKISDVTDNVGYQQLMLRSLGNALTFQSVILAGEFLDKSETQQEAAWAVMNICLSSGSYSGQSGHIVRDLLTRITGILDGPEKDYEIERIRKYLDEMPETEGFVSMFDGATLEGWQGFAGSPVKRASIPEEEMKKLQEQANKKLSENWSVKDGMIVFNGKGQNLVSVKEYGDFEMLVDWKITKNGDSGIYLRGTPQVQIWDTSRRDVGAQAGSGGLYNNQRHRNTPLAVADNNVGEWNTFRILMRGERVSVYLNGLLVVDNEILENYWERDKPVFPTGPVELQAHGSNLAFRNIFIRKIPSARNNKLSEEESGEGFILLFNGRNLDGWVGNKTDYVVENGEIVIYPGKGGSGNLYTENEYSDFILRFEFQLTPGANNGLGIRSPQQGDAAYAGMELQILDNTAEIYKKLQDYQYHGSVYGVIPARRGYLKPVGEWNVQEVRAIGPNIKVVLNGEVIVDGNIEEAGKGGTIDGKEHPGLANEKGHIGFLGHGSIVRFRNIRILEF